MSIPVPVLTVLKLVSSKALIRAANRVPAELWGLGADSLEKRAMPTPSGKLLRAAFWSAVRTLIADGGKLDLRALCARAGVSYPHGYDLVTGDPEFLAWMLQPSLEFQTCSRFLIVDAVEKLQEIISLPIHASNGEPNIKNLNQILRAVGTLMDIPEAFPAARRLR